MLDMAEPSLDYRLGRIEAQLAEILRRLDENSRRFGELADQIRDAEDRMERRLLVLEIAHANSVDLPADVERLKLVEAKRTGVLAAIGIAAGFVGGALGLLAPIFLERWKN